jgi:hypothetical protein
MAAAGQPQERLVNQRSRLKRTNTRLAPEMGGRQSLQLVINERDHGLQSFSVSFVNTLQQLGNFHG